MKLPKCGEPLIVELNGLLNSGLYASNPTLLTNAYATQRQRTSDALAGHALTWDGGTCLCGDAVEQHEFVQRAAAHSGLGRVRRFRSSPASTTTRSSATLCAGDASTAAGGDDDAIPDIQGGTRASRELLGCRTDGTAHT